LSFCTGIKKGNWNCPGVK